VLSPSAGSNTQIAPAVQADAEGLRHRFNAEASMPRLVFLVSPTCDVCVSGAESAAQAVLSLSKTIDFRLYLLWLPVLENDTWQTAEAVHNRLPTDTRMAQFWDRDLIVSQSYHRVLQLTQRQRRHRIAWDLFLLYRADRVWTDGPPVPDFWMHQLFLDDVPKLDTSILKRQLEQMIGRVPADNG
jgi:hypothetical protein